jgi:hypothetical protein
MATTGSSRYGTWLVLGILAVFLVFALAFLYVGWGMADSELDRGLQLSGLGYVAMTFGIIVTLAVVRRPGGMGEVLRQVGPLDRLLAMENDSPRGEGPFARDRCHIVKNTSAVQRRMEPFCPLMPDQLVRPQTHCPNSFHTGNRLEMCDTVAPTRPIGLTFLGPALGGTIFRAGRSTIATGALGHAH